MENATLTQPRIEIRRMAWAGLCFLVAVLSFIVPAWPGNEILHYIGKLLIWAGVVEIFDSSRGAERPSKSAAQWSGAISFLMAGLLVNSILLQPKALYTFITALFGINALHLVWLFFRGVQD